MPQFTLGTSGRPPAALLALEHRDAHTPGVPQVGCIGRGVHRDDWIAAGQTGISGVEEAAELPVPLHRRPALRRVERFGQPRGEDAQCGQARSLRLHADSWVHSGLDLRSGLCVQPGHAAHWAKPVPQPSPTHRGPRPHALAGGVSARRLRHLRRRQVAQRDSCLRALLQPWRQHLLRRHVQPPPRAGA